MPIWGEFSPDLRFVAVVVYGPCHAIWRRGATTTSEPVTMPEYFTCRIYLQIPSNPVEVRRGPRNELWLNTVSKGSEQFFEERSLIARHILNYDME